MRDFILLGLLTLFGIVGFCGSAFLVMIIPLPPFMKIVGWLGLCIMTFVPMNIWWSKYIEEE